jgi:hypothetical protein
MSIANELISDVAAALLTYKNNRGHFEAERLPEIVRKFHLTLRDLSNKVRTKRTYREFPDAASAGNDGGRH